MIRILLEIVEYKISNKSKNGFVGAPPTKPWNSTLESYVLGFLVKEARKPVPTPQGAV